ncbi:unnamed protein product [Nyctereutes procyonoides]|uniref:(raccoon dog) hypothetical protein n=1 Tax=Nyctereutes procyonoides TaxID=34880 RepID=A0A811XU91_NYCPR|nr:unnamed protein product [Nyctereutes procyonoides]
MHSMEAMSKRSSQATRLWHHGAIYASIQTEDGGQFMCDINSTAHHGISKNHNHKELQLTGHLLTCPSKEFIKDNLVELLDPRYILLLDIQDRILRGTDVRAVRDMYPDLLKEGVQFPPSDAEAESARQTGQLHSELDVVTMNMTVLSARLRQTHCLPGSENHEDTELLRKPYMMGQESQNRIVDLLTVVENADVTVELIQWIKCPWIRKHQRILEQNKNQREDAHATSGTHPVISLTPAITNNLKPSLPPQVGLLALVNTETPPFPQRASQSLTWRPTYETASLQAIPATPSSRRLSSLPNNHSATAKNDLQPPKYYGVMGFDSLAPAVTTEAMYEKGKKKPDVYHHKRALSRSDH